ncbi:hypothetical protein CYMTET_49079 [Cymbomonas tetramitiformis]|uniref:Uncharacterized protein n=1 Tax=Cymbomonas tetramitiformis TaxID=36881 RepID=A0AAE0BSM8_9CHLO|nr:hypothetical protein CYMTET_49079 [Cymbomonas tetramitiformis]
MEEDRPETPLGRQVGGTYVGAVYRGTTRALGTSPVRATASIPSKFETIINVGAKEQDAFCSRTHRFTAQGTDLPGPGQYHKPSGFTFEHDSISKKGYGSGFVSKHKRFTDHALSAPGPGAYESTEMVKAGAKNFNRAASTSTFALKSKDVGPPLEPKVKSKPVPGPGEYEASAAEAKQATTHMFRSNVERFGLSAAENASVAPGQYGSVPTFDKGGAGAVFRSSTVRNPGGPLQGRRVSAASAPSVIYGDSGFSGKEPGPGQYDNTLTDLQYKFRHGPKMSSMFSRTAQDRFGDSMDPRVARENAPGPGQYASTNPLPRTVHGGVSVFSSSTARAAEDSISTTGGLAKPPGPAFYHPAAVNMKSYNLNARKRWL